ncbi:MAG: ATPase [Proteobacteria bacterium]|nr:ATPase [Pseudomonadota bacterium]
MKRFYKEVAVVSSASPVHGEAHAVTLDGKPVKTPGRSTLAVPSRALAEAIADEWRRQGETVLLESMPLTKLANTALDRAPAHRQALVEQVICYGRSDLLCYRADQPEKLAARQEAVWNQLLEWLSETYRARLSTCHGIGFVEQPPESLIALEQAVWKYDAFALTALHTMASILGSLTLALALIEQRLCASEAFAASQLDEDFQAEKWGRDAEAEKRRKLLLSELEAAERFVRLLE